MATVTSCTYETGAGQAMAFGIPNSKHFHITFNYWADGQLHIGQFHSAKPVPQSTLFPITYNPTAPHEHTYSEKSAPARTSVITIAITGSLLIGTLWLILLHSCFR